jgi:molybdate transport system substrate-binding protein
MMNLKNGKILITLLMILSTTTYTMGQENRYDPPWNAPPENAVNFTVKGVDNVPDIYGDINDPQLVIFMGGNQFMVLDDLLATFRIKYREYQRILVETLPPGLLFEQIKNGSLVIGNMRISLKPDIYTTGKNKIEENKNMFDRMEPFTATKIALMVQQGNPKKIDGLKDLEKENIRVSMPDKKIEGIGNTVEEAYIKAGGKELHDRIMVEKVKDGTTFITQIHHRQSPMRILYAQSDVAPVWETEIFYQKRLGHPVDMVEIADEYNKISVSMAGLLKDAPNKDAANHFMDFLKSGEAQAIFKKYGFKDVPQINE